MNARLALWFASAAITVAAGAAATAGPALAASGDWLSAGQDVQDTHSTNSEHQLSRYTVAGLQQRWVLTTTGHVSSTPAVAGNTLYAVDSGGMLYAVNKLTGAVIWKQKISTYSGIATSFSRTTPAISGNLLVIGDQGSAGIFAVNRTTGALVWKTVLDTTQGAIITSSPVVSNGRVFVGVSSTQESLAQTKGFSLSFRGQAAALDLTTGKVLWSFRTVPTGYTGGAVWGSSLAVDPSRNTVFVPVGNNYSVPASVQQCQGSAPTVQAAIACVSPDDHYDSIVALNVASGQVKWSRFFEGPDDWTLQCVMNVAGGVPCPAPSGPDYDFGSGPNLYTTHVHGRQVDILGAGQKSGVYWGINPDNGSVLWATQVGPGATLGGIEYGAASDGTEVYTGIGNANHIETTLRKGQIVNGGFWSALNAATGQILWQTPAVGVQSNGMGALANGSVSVANGVMYAEDHGGFFVALDARTGSVLWKFQSGGSAIGGPAISDGWLYWGSGYKLSATDVDNNKLYAFSIN